MLVIRRRPGESFMLGDDIEVEVLEIAGNQVKLGIRAPQAVRVARKELHTVSRQNLASAASTADDQVDFLLKRFKNFSTGR